MKPVGAAPATRSRRAAVVVAVMVALLAGVVPGHAAIAPREEPVTDGWSPASRRQRADAPAQSAGFTQAQMRIPAIGLDEAVRAGVDLSVIDRGPAHWIGTALPGSSGNVVIAGHRTTHGAPFRNLHQLEPGHLVYVTDPRGFEVMYRVVETFVVTPDALWITWDNGEALLTMFACHPLGSAAKRIVVRAEMVANRLIA